MSKPPAVIAPGRARYLMRLDDVCPTMDWAIFNRFEAVMDRYGVKPILAVIPDNQDPNFQVDPPVTDFWERVRHWQSKGWTIGLHGYQHRYVTPEGGILGLSKKSEFAGLPYGVQLEKLQKAVDIFSRERIQVDCWIAPSHAFDLNTLTALNILGIRTISDGMALQPFRDDKGNTWVPQQFATMRPMPWGTWTFCYHFPNFDSEASWETFERQLKMLAPQMTTFQDALARGDRARSLLDRSVQFVRFALTFTRRLAGGH